MDGIVKLQLLVDLLTCLEALGLKHLKYLVASRISGSIDAKGFLSL
jgi:hypothetical protein